MNFLRLRLLCVLAVLAVVLPMMTVVSGLAQGSERVHLHLDPATSEVHFTLKDTLHTVHGSFRLSAGDIVFNPKSGEAQGKISVETGSGASGNDTRDGRMKREYLNVGKFPVAEFEPQKVTGFDAGVSVQKIVVAGNLILLGDSHAMTLEFELSQTGKQAAAIAHFMIPYVAWGIKDPSIPFVKVEKQVAIDVVAKGSLSSENQAAVSSN